MKTPISILALALISAVHAQYARPGQRMVVDVDGDGRPEVVDIVAGGKQPDGHQFHDVRVCQQDGQEIWRGGRSGDMQLGDWNWGSTMPRTVGDIDGDGRPEMIVSTERNDGGPPIFRSYKWSGRDGYRLSKSGVLGLSRGGNDFVWYGEDAAPAAWVTSMEPSQGRWMCDVTTRQRDGGYGTRSAILAPRGDGGLGVVQWVQGWDAGFAGNPGVDQGRDHVRNRGDRNHGGQGWDRDRGRHGFNDNSDPLLTRYRARISDKDHFSGSGERFDSVAEILRKDRSNLYKGLGDPEDEGDNLFRDPKKSDLFGKLKISADDRVKDQIRKQTPLVEVSVTKSGIFVRMLAPANQGVEKPGFLKSAPSGVQRRAQELKRKARR